MGLTWAEQSRRIAAPRERCYEAIADFDSYPAWQTAVEATEVLETWPDGRGKLVEVRVDAKVRRVRYRLIYHHEPPGRLWWEFVEGDGVEHVEGEFRLEDATSESSGDLTEATYRLGIDVGIPVPGLLARQLSRGVMARVVEDLRKRVE